MNSIVPIVPIVPEPRRRAQRLTFRRFLRQYRSQNSALGDLAADVRLDRNFPDVRSWKTLERYLSRVGASHNALETARRAWALYAAACKTEAGAP